MLINDLSRDIHQNAVEHGWWETKRDNAETFALIHSEWSEALEEARAGRPLVWFKCNNTGLPCDQDGCGDFNDGECDIDEMSKKPEGIAVELIDGCIRIFDFFGEKNATIILKPTNGPAHFEDLYSGQICDDAENIIPDNVAALIAHLHASVSLALLNEDKIIENLMTAVLMAVTWISMQGLDPLAILLDKHKYNKSRPYKHGKKF